jgi:hypothetical protein
MITPEQRDQQPPCGARKKDGELCRAFAGQGTKHPGVGKCKHHLGNAPMHERRAIKLEVQRAMISLGEPMKDISALDAMLSELYASCGHVSYLRQQIAESTPEYLGTLEGLAITSLYNSERDRKVRIAKQCIESGVAEAAIRVAETQIAVMGQALAKAADTAGLSEPMRARLGAALRDELAQADAKPQALPA